MPMILPANVTFQGMIGGTFDAVITLYESQPNYFSYGVWNPTYTYPVNAVVIAPDNNAYVCLISNLGKNPVNDGAHWQELTPVTLTGWAATFQCNASTTSPMFTLTSSDEGGITIDDDAGTITLHATTEDTTPFTAGVFPCYLQTVDTDSNTYFPVSGRINFRNPLPPVWNDAC